jgi:hypothetical protein
MAGRVPWRFRTRDLKSTPGTRSSHHYLVGNEEYAENAINTMPRNHSIRPYRTDPGYFVRKGMKPAFFWLGNGKYELILNHGHCLEPIGPGDEDFDMAEGDEETLILSNVRGANRPPIPIKIDVDRVRYLAKQDANPAAIIVQYLAEEPFQAYYRRKPLGLV